MQTSKPKKLTAGSPDEFPLIIAATPASKQERRVALAIILILSARIYSHRAIRKC